jgi:hypothetical protein
VPYTIASVLLTLAGPVIVLYHLVA